MNERDKKTKAFIVFVREVHVIPVLVGARDKDDAIVRVRAGVGEYKTEQLDYSHTLDSSTWTVEET